MAKLVKLETVRTRGGLPDADENNALLAASLEAATVHLEAILHTSFTARVGFVDQYWVDQRELPFYSGMGFIKLMTTHGFVLTAPAVVIKAASTLADLATAAAIDPGYIKYDYEKGLIMITGHDPTIANIPRLDLDRSFVQVTYNCGFQETNTAFGKVFSAVPEWLQELATIVALAIYKGGTDCAKSSNVQKCTGLDMNVLVAGHTRWFPSAFRPLI